MTKTSLAVLVAEEATGWIGTPYRHQGSLRGVGADCLGLLRGVWRSLYGEEPEAFPPYSPDWAEISGRDLLLEAADRHLVRSPTAPVRGDCIVFRWRPDAVAKHVGIMVDSDAFVHAYSGIGTVRSPLVPQWRRKIAGVFRFPDPVDERGLS